MRVLHVSEVMGGGVVSAVLAMLDSTPGIDHHLAVWPRRAHFDTGDDWATAFASVHTLPSSVLGAARSLRRLERDLFPDAFHAHSSLAGFVTRVAGVESARVVYSPHCFAGERRNTGPWKRRATDLVERLLVPRTGVLAGVSPHEVELALGLGHQRAAYVPNRALLAPRPAASFAQPLQVATVGRIAAQKDWRFFLHVKRYVTDELGVDATWTWIGGGTEDAEAALTAGGVEVTGWIPRERLMDRLTEAQVYLHTAAWEGAPISVFEAAAVGLPLAVRGIPTMRSLGLPGTHETAADLGRRIAELTDRRTWSAAQQASLDTAAAYSRAEQGRRLYAVYEQATGRPAGPHGLTALSPTDTARFPA